MLKSLFVPSLLLTTALISACGKLSNHDKSPNNNPPPPNNKLDWPSYSEQSLSGRVFEKEWKALTAAAHINKNNKDELIINIYSENHTDSCDTQFVSKNPYATVIIPTQYTQAEYIADMNNLDSNTTGNPLVFISIGEVSKNLVADKTKLKIFDITPTGFQMSLFASGQEIGGKTSEINGKISVADCNRTVDFKVWEELAGYYRLKSFDGVNQNNQMSIIEISHDMVYDKATKKYLPMVVFPLFSSVSSGSDVSSEFGPIKGLGQTTLVEDDSGKSLTYSYSGPVNYKDTDVTLNFSMTVKQNESSLAVQYTIEVPSYISKSTHSFVLQK